MKCDWTQKVSLLIDAELDGAEAREVERHLDACGDCQQARADFLLLRQQIAAYQIERDALAEHRALKRILAAGSGEAKFETGHTVAQPRRQRERFAGVFGLPRLSPVGLAALLLVLVGIAIGVVSLVNVRRAPVEVVTTVPTPSAPVKYANDSSNGNPHAAPPATPNNSTAGINQGGETVAGNQQKGTGAESASETNRRVMGGRNRGRAPQRVENANNKIPKASPIPILDQTRDAAPVAESADNGSNAFEAGDDILRRDAPATDGSKTARHVEQAQLLLRSFRNSRPAERAGRASSDLAYDKRQSKKLLYQNIVLRREAASRGNLPVESLLDSLEPILIDIANLPDRPAPSDVREINERMRRKNLVAMLQISSVESASARN